MRIIIIILLLLAFGNANGQTRPSYYLIFDKTDVKSQVSQHTIFNGNVKQYERVFMYYHRRLSQPHNEHLLYGHPPDFVTFNKNQYTVVPLSSLYQQYNVKTVTNFEVDLRGKNFDAGIAYLESFDFYIVELLPVLGVAHIHKVYCNNSEE